MSLHDLDELRRLRDEFHKTSGPPSLFHVTRMLFDLEGNAHDGLHQDWEEFLGNIPPLELSVDEVCGPFFQQSGYFGAIEKINDYTGLAASTLGQFPSGTSPIVYPHRDTRTDRNQWTLGLYRFSRRLEWQIAVDFRGSGSYSRLNMDSDAVVLLGCFTHDPDRLRRYHQSWATALLQPGIVVPRYAYAAIVTDLFTASALAIDLHVKDVEAGHHDPRPLVLLPEQIASIGRGAQATTPKPPTDHERPQEASAENMDVKPDPWPPDNGWHFRPGEFAFGGRKGKLTGKLWLLLKTLVEARRALTAENLRDVVWEHNEDCTVKNIRTHLSMLRTVLRTTYDLPNDLDLIPSADVGVLAAWRLDELRLIRK